MKLVLEEMREIARTLPIGFYLGRKVPVLIEESCAAYTDIVKGDIHIGIGLLQMAANHIDAKDAAKWNRETLLRCLLYHEVGHQLLTPKWLKFLPPFRKTDGTCLTQKKTADILNIFEDERLERILSGYFIGVKFREFCELVNKGSPAGKDAVGRVYDAIRLRNCTPEVDAAIDATIATLGSYTAITEACPWEDGGCIRNAEEFAQEVEKLVKLILDSEPPEQSQSQPQQSQSEQSQSESEAKQDEQSEAKQNEGEQDKSEQSKDDKKSEDEGKDESDADEGKDDADDGKGKGEEDDESEGEDGDGDGEEDSEEDSEDAAKSAAESEDESEDEINGKESGKGLPPSKRVPGLTPDYLKELAAKVFATPTPEIANVLNRFAQRLAKQKGAQAAGRWSALHGKISARRDAMGKERIFRRQSDVGERLNTAVHLTLWVDCSGSFSNSVPTLNKILAATATAAKMSGGRLDVDVVHMKGWAEVASPNAWAIVADGGNELDTSYYDCWRKTRRRDRRNIDIVVFDGDAKGRTYYAPDRKTPVEVAIWNHPDCHMIMDDSNKRWGCDLPKAHITYMDSGYAEQLEAEVMKMLDRIL